MDEDVDIAESFFAIRVASAIAFAILYYDYALTFGHEFERFWKRPFSLVAFGYYFNRYLSLLGHVPVIVEIYGRHSQSLQMYHQVLAAATQISVGTLQIYRVYGLYERSRKVLYLLVAVAVTACIVSGWAISRTWTADKTESSRIIDECDLRMSKQQTRYLAIAWGMVLIYDVLIFSLTSCRVMQVGRKWRGSLFTLMLRDGTLYFGVLLACHLTNILTCLVGQPAFRGISVTTTNVIATTMIARLMLNVRDPDLIEGRFRGTSETQVSSPLTQCCFEMQSIR